MIYIKGLNGIRAIASVSILFFHINELNEILGISHISLMQNWNYGVTFFFALSGFLITYLLLTKKAQLQNISYKNFYINRIYRIFPLYFLYFFLIIGFHLIFKNEVVSNQLIFYIFFSANIPFLLSNAISLLGHYWSLGTEEQFYIFWPFIINKTKNFLRVFFYIFFSFTSLKIIGRILDSKYNIPILTSGFQTFAFDNMLIGAIGAYFYIYKNEFIKNISLAIGYRLSCSSALFSCFLVSFILHP